MKATEIEQPSSNLTGEGLPANKGVEEAQKSPCRLTVVEANPQTDARWETFVNQHPCGSIYHHPAWLKALELEYGHKGNYLLCEDDAGGVLAILPLSRTRGLPLRLGGALSGRRLSSLPRTPVAGPLSIDRRATAAVLENAVKRVSNDVVTQVQIKTQSTEIDGLVDGMACMPWRLSYVLRLQNNFDSQFRVPDAAHRHNIGKAVRKALKLGVNVRPAETAGDLEAWYALYLDTMRRNFVPARPFRFFVALWEILQPKAMFRLLLAEQKQGSHDKIIAGAILLKFGRTVSFAFAGSSQANLALRPNDIIFWKAINEACSEGFEAFDFGEVPEDRPDLARYKGKWGAEPIRLYRYHYPAPQSNPAIVESTGFAKRLAHGVWRHLPLRATAYLSDRVYRFL